MRMRISMKSSVELLRERGIGRGHPVQLYIAQSAIRRMRKYTPQDTQVLADVPYAAKGGTMIRQYTPYERIQYEGKHFRHRGIQTHSWFDAMKKNGGVNAILREARIRSGAR